MGLLRLICRTVMAATLLFAAVAVARPLLPGLFWPLSVVYSVPTRDHVVALTYDDGPNATYTPQVLEILDRYHVRATFFMVGERMVRYPALARRVAARGHALGNHTYTHPHMFIDDTPARMASEIDRTEQCIRQASGSRCRLFRPPLGWVNGPMLNVAQQRGYEIVLWTVSADHHDAPTPQAMAERVFKQVRPGAIVLLHDGSLSTRWMDVAATPLIIEGLQRRGYRFVTVPELLARRSRSLSAGWGIHPNMRQGPARSASGPVGTHSWPKFQTAARASR